jgi:crossover junction endodeoxyribonuclease RuvC
MRFIGIDPGYDRVGLAVVERDTISQSDRVIFSDCYETDRSLPLVDRLRLVGDQVAATISTHQPSALGLETLFFSKNHKTAMAVAEARGIIMYLAHVANCQIYEFHPQEIKVAITGYGKSDKVAVTTMIKKLVANCPETAFDDEYDAIAIAVTGLAHLPRAQ